ncbi:hypothetical protein WMY93_000876 [Mugilogobius chulae]|uniref:Uncharacterized protein n=1 Tax=Mugilogobius chulae TaxID=88201 RepID=A0AAW0Q227_9GOBI
MKELEKTHKDELTKINRNMSSLKEEMTTLEKKNKSLQQNGVDVIDLKQKLAERDKQLKEEISKANDLERHLADATKTVLSHMTNKYIDLELPPNLTDKDLYLKYTNLYDTFNRLNNQLAEKSRDYDKLLAEHKKKPTERIITKTDGSIPDLRFTIRNQKDKIQTLQGEVQMHSNQTEQLQKQNNGLKEEVKHFKTAYFKLKSQQFNEQQLSRKDQSALRCDEALQSKKTPQLNTIGIIASAKPSLKRTVLPPIPSKRTTAT